MAACSLLNAIANADSATLHRWYENWIKNKDKVLEKYGERWYRVSSIHILSLSLSLSLSSLPETRSCVDPDSPYLQVWLYFLASSVITSRQGGASVFQITLHKNLNGFPRIDLVNEHASIHPKLQKEPS
jgi:cyclopropane fatty-acyl-phospholipid synthase-like methyltransferase